jgi:amino acid adenylation domain-containing protein
LHQLFEAQVERSPEALALCWEESVLTYGELNLRANRLAHHLRSLGVGPEVRVGVIAEHPLDMVMGLWGTLKAGGTCVPLDAEFPEERLAFLVGDAGIDVLLTRDLSCAGLAVSGVRVVSLVGAGQFQGRRVDQNPDPRATVDNLAYVIYTSGSTGQPKGVPISHRNLLPLIHWSRDFFGLGADTRVLNSLSYTFDFGVFEILSTLIYGGVLVLQDRDKRGDVRRYVDCLRNFSINTIHITPSFFRAVSRVALDGVALDGALAGLRVVHFGGEALAVPLVEQAASLLGDGCSIYNGYGPTETTVTAAIFSVWLGPSQPRLSSIPIGRAPAATRLFVLDPTARPVPTGAVGELCVGGIGVSRGYLNRSRLTAEKFIPNPCWEFSTRAGERYCTQPRTRPCTRLYRTGDLVRFRPVDGQLEFLGRIDHQVKLRGLRIELGEIESLLLRQDGVREVVVMVRGQDAETARLVAFVVSEAATVAVAGSGEGLRAILEEQLPGYMVPGVFVFLESLPLTSSGKVDRAALELRTLPSATNQPATATWRDPAEEILAGLWAEILGLAKVSATDDFFRLGGHSLLATRLVTRVREVFGITLELRALFERPTPRKMAAEIVVRRQEGPVATVSPLLPVERQGPLALSFAQERLWVLDRFEPGSPAYNIVASLRLCGILEVEALRRALDVVVARHEILRTTFEAVGGEPFQCITPALQLPFPQVDLTALGESAQQRTVERWSRQVAATSFDLAEGPLLRQLLLSTAPGETILLLAVHHIISDGWSIVLLLEELTSAYEAIVAGEAPELPSLAVQYADFAAWQRQQGSLLEIQAGYWKERLAGAPPGVELPMDGPRPGVRTYRGRSLRLGLDPDLSTSLRNLSKEHGATLFMTLLAVFKILLQRLSGESDVVVGSPIAGRGMREVEPLMGIFLNTLVLRTDVSGSPTFIELLGRLRETALGAYAHQDVPFERLLEELRPERDLSRTPFFQIFFNMINLPRPGIALSSLELELLSPLETPAKFDLTVYAEDLGDRVQFDLVYNADLFTAERMEEVKQQYSGLLLQVAADPEQQITQYSLLTAASRAVLPDPQETLSNEWWGAVHQIFSRLARQAPDRPAVLAAELDWSYGELEDLANRLAQRLCAGGVAAGDIVAIYGRRDPRLVLAVLAVLKAGAAFVILDPIYPAERLIECLRLAAPVGWIEMPMPGSDPGATEVLPELLAEYFQISPPRCRVLLPAAAGLAGLAGLAGSLAPWSARDPLVAVGQESLAYIAFTSGSTGTPKGILGRHGPLSHFIPWQQQEFGLSENDRFSMLSGIAHDPLQRDLFTPLQIGGVICIPDPSFLGEPGRLAEWMKNAEITIAHLTPAMGQVLTEASPDRASVELDHLRYAFLVGDILTRRDVARLRELAPDLTCVNFFGSTETQRAVGYAKIAPSKTSLPNRGSEATSVGGISGKAVLPLGRGMQNVQLLVLNRSGALAGIGEIGEIYVRSPHLGRGYLGDPAGTAERFLPSDGGSGERLYRTGDLGRYLPAGDVEFAGRADHQIKVRGFRIEPGEIERLIDSHPAVGSSVVFAQDGPGREKRLVAFVATERQEVVPELRALVKSRLPDFMVPAAFVLLEKLPLTPNGKLDRVALDRFASGGQTSARAGGETLAEATGPGEVAAPHTASRTAPRTETERVITAVLREVLGVEEVGLKDSFFELGGNSLMMVRVQSRLSEIFGREIQVVELFTHPTVAELADLLGDGKGRTPSLRLDADRSDELHQGKSRRQLRFEKMRRRKQGPR